MEDIIENKVVDLVTAATITEVSDYHPVNIDTVMQDWDSMEDYPAIIVTCAEVRMSGEQIGAKNQLYRVYIFVLVVAETKAEVAIQRRTIKDRIVSKFRTVYNLDRLTDNDNNERVYDSAVEEVLFATEGYYGNYLGTARIYIPVHTEKLKPF